jgi:tetratricopeptide (TPR) repeat protein
MSRVFVAERTEGGFLQRAALKLFHAGSGWNESLARRFEQERQLLAALEDPDIARVLDGGVSPGGHPFLVMELVDGEPIDVHCAQRGLSLRERIVLVQRASRAVQHAHRNLVVHRDIKPSNILVTPQGAVKLLDFGIAKVLEGSTALAGLDLDAPETRTTARPLTPAYASPEQVRGGPITTASDVYQLGLLAYELIDGRPAHRFKDGTWREFERVVCEAEPPRLGRQPATLTGSTDRPAKVPPDLETVILKALNKDPARRYGSAEQFAEDLGHFLADQPVLARPDTAWYRARKFVRRHRLATSALATIGLLVLAASLGFANLSRRLASERDRAQLEAGKSAAVAQFLVGLFQANDPEENLGESLTARDLLDRGASRLDSESDLDPRLRIAMELNVAAANLHIRRAEVAQRIARRALDSARASTPRIPGSEAEALHLLAWSAEQRGQFAESEKLARAAIASALVELPPGDWRLPVYYQALGEALDGLGRSREAEAIYLEAVRRLRPAGGDVRNLSDALQGLGLARLDLGHLEGAEAATREALELLVTAYGADDLRTVWARNNLGRVLERRGALAEAHRLYETSLAMRHRLFGRDHASTALAEHNLARLDGAMGNWDEALRRNAEAYRIRRTLLGGDHPLTCVTLLNKGIYERELLRLELSASSLLEAADCLSRRFGESHRHAASARVYAALVLLDLGRGPEAQTASATAGRVLADGAARDRVPAAILLGRLSQAARGTGEAIAHFERAVTEGRGLGEPLYRPTLEAEFLLAVEKARRSGGGPPSPELAAAAATVRESSPRLRQLVDSALALLAGSS